MIVGGLGSTAFSGRFREMATMKALLVRGICTAVGAVWITACSGGATISEPSSPSGDAGSTDAGTDRDAGSVEDAAIDAPDDATAPLRPPRHPPFDLSGDVGWRDSHEPFCNALSGPGGGALFADARGVFVFNSVQNNPLAGYDGPSGYLLYFNDGTGWESLLSETGGLDQVGPIAGGHLTAIPGGTLFMVRTGIGVWVSSDGYEYEEVDGDARDTSATAQLGYTLFADHVAVHDGTQ